ncbi:MAG: type II toxin-antitoxin system VapB family antitoxin [Candidatus Korobacteraceae bacterium]
MALNIKNGRTCALVEELAQLTGENMTEAIEKAVEERLEKTKRHKKKEGVAERLMQIARETAPLIPESLKSTPHGDLLYDENGLPK